MDDQAELEGRRTAFERTELVKMAQIDRHHYNRIERVVESSRQIPTSDDWSPTLEGGFVEVKCFIHAYIQDQSRTYFCRICIWGGDDTGREIDFTTSNFETALTFYEKWSNWMGQIALIDFEELKLLGFVTA